MLLKNWSKYWGPAQDEFSDRDLSIIVGFIDNIQYLNDCRKILDIGCGTGKITQYLQATGKEVHGITYQQKEVETAKARGVSNIYLGDMHAIPFGEDLFDAFIMWDSLEHSQAPYIALCEAKRILIPGGRGLIFMPSQDWVDCPYHQITLTVRQMKHLLGISGFSILEIVDHGNEQAVYKIVK
jgi:ubiquinone/menaquinone biosynthesis C-methylase UbiE